MYGLHGGIQEAQANGRLIAAAPTAPHECDPSCQGEQNRRKLADHADAVSALEAVFTAFGELLIELGGPDPEDRYTAILDQARAILERERAVTA